MEQGTPREHGWATLRPAARLSEAPQPPPAGQVTKACNFRIGGGTGPQATEVPSHPWEKMDDHCALRSHPLVGHDLSSFHWMPCQHPPKPAAPDPQRPPPVSQMLPVAPAACSVCSASKARGWAAFLFYIFLLVLPLLAALGTLLR